MSWHTVVAPLRALAPQLLASVVTLVALQLGVSQQCAAELAAALKHFGL